LTLALWAPSAEAGSLKDLDKRNGFRSWTFEKECSAIDDLVGFKQAADPGTGTVTYIRRPDELEVGEARLLSISYTCYKGLLAGVELRTTGATNVNSLYATLVDAYGEPTNKAEDVTFFGWKGKSVYLSYIRPAATDEAVVLFTSLKVQDMRRKDEAKAAASEKAAAVDAIEGK
jgi:hypothetical protein